MTPTTATAATSEKRLPSPDVRPGADVVIFDGDCRICTGQIRLLARLDRGQRLSFISLHDPLVAERYPDLSHDDLMQQMYVVDGEGRRHGGVEAVRYLARRLPLLWWLAPLLHIPGSLPVWRFGYRSFARFRYRFGRTGACENGQCRVHF
jgi:predicted DCC family thiol-disulfide oxidoreductase YuxK